MKKATRNWRQTIVMGLVGAVSGFLLSYLIISQQLAVYQVMGLVLSIPIFYFLHIILHETGHAVFGYLTGYQMVSYRILSFLWVWQEGGVVYRRQKVPGTLGQCLMRPPSYQEGHFPFKLYLLGGVLANFLSSGLVCFLFQFRSYSLIFGVVGLFVGLTNVMPAGFNDGMSLKLAWSNHQRQYLLYLQFEINYQLSNGKSYQELPESYFEPLPEDLAASYFGTFHELVRCGRHLEKHELSSARAILESLYQQLDEIIPIYQVEIQKELLFCLALLEPTDERIEPLLANKLVQSSLHQPTMANKRILASYAYFVKKDWQEGASLTQGGLALVEKPPLKGEAKLELALLEWLDEQAIIYFNRGMTSC